MGESATVSQFRERRASTKGVKSAMTEGQKQARNHEAKSLFIRSKASGGTIDAHALVTMGAIQDPQQDTLDQELDAHTGRGVDNSQPLSLGGLREGRLGSSMNVAASRTNGKMLTQSCLPTGLK